jgi:hypothetical protein
VCGWGWGGGGRVGGWVAGVCVCVAVDLGGAVSVVFDKEAREQSNLI